MTPLIDLFDYYILYVIKYKVATLNNLIVLQTKNSAQPVQSQGQIFKYERSARSRSTASTRRTF